MPGFEPRITEPVLERSFALPKIHNLPRNPFQWIILYKSAVLPLHHVSIKNNKIKIKQLEFMESELNGAI